MGSRKTAEEERHAAGGPGKAAKEGHIDPDKANKPGQKQSVPKDGGPGGESGEKGVPPERRRDAG